MPPRRSGRSWGWNFSKGSTSRNAISVSSTEQSVEAEPSENQPTRGREVTPEPMMPSQPAVIEISSDSSQQLPDYMDQEEITGGNYMQDYSFQGDSTNNVGSSNEYYPPYLDDHTLAEWHNDLLASLTIPPPIEVNPWGQDYPMDPIGPEEIAAYARLDMEARRLEEEALQNQTMTGNIEQGESSQRRRLTPGDTMNKTKGEIAKMRKESRFPNCTGRPIIRKTARKSVRRPPRIARPAKVVRCYLCNEENLHSDQCPYNLGMVEMMCHKCGEQDHYWTICPQNRSNQPPAASPHSPAANSSEGRSPNPSHSFSSSRN